VDLEVDGGRGGGGGGGRKSDCSKGKPASLLSNPLMIITSIGTGLFADFDFDFDFDIDIDLRIGASSSMRRLQLGG
jgi:hypothetical protein